MAKVAGWRHNLRGQQRVAIMMSHIRLVIDDSEQFVDSLAEFFE
ncbi:hypothetical protein DSUL_50288 [Desulfovibrionales bacterium]